jgi:hypothetical protein
LDTSYLPCFQQQLSCQRKMVAELPLLLTSNRWTFTRYLALENRQQFNTVVWDP